MKIFQDFIDIIEGKNNYEIRAACSYTSDRSDVLSKNLFSSKRLSFIYNADESGLYVYRVIEMRDAWKKSKYLNISNDTEIVIEEYISGTRFPIINIIVDDEKKIIYLVYDPAKTGSI